VLIGRSEEMAELEALLDHVRGGMSGAVVLRGEAGIGKTALLNALVEAAGDLVALRIEGIESEMQFGYAALHRLLLPYLSHLSHLPEPQRYALSSAFGLASVAPADRFLVGLAALTLLGDVAKERPLLIAVDDAQWLDHESVGALVFVARRLHADRMALVFAARESLEVSAVFQGIPELGINGLGEESARHLLASSLPDPVNYQVAGRIIAVTRGNPLALLELSGELSSEHLVDRSLLPDPLPIGQLIEARFLRQVGLLPDDTQMILLAAAADPDGDPATLWRVAQVLGLSAVAVEPAVDSGLLVLDPRVEFRHPLVRSAVYSGASSADRRHVHQALAEVTDSEQDQDRRALHLASAALGPDEDIATALERSAAQARARGGYVAESSFLVRAANLTPEPPRQAARFLLAAEASFLGGNAGYAESLLKQARPLLDDPAERAKAQRLDGRLQVPLARSSLSPSLLLGAARAFEPIDRVLTHHSLLEAFLGFMICGHLAEETTAVEVAQAALSSLSAQSTPVTPADTLLKGVALRYAGSYAEAVPAMREAVRAQTGMSFEENNGWSFLGSMVAQDLLDEAELRASVEQLERAARAQGALYSLQVALQGLAIIETRAGCFDVARERYSELHDVTVATGGYVDFYDLQDVDLLAWQGDERTRDKAALVVELATGMRAAGNAHYASLSLSILQLAEGQYEQALASAQSVTDRDFLGWGCLALPNVVEAAMRCGHREAASDALTVLAERATASGTPWALGLLARCRALMAGRGDAAVMFEEALDQLGRTSWRTEVARTHLVYGEWLRRQRQRTEAGEQLRKAFEMFDAMGAKAFAERARVELLATGERARSRRVKAAHDLTSRELQVARLAAERATSREIAGQLFISANTVDYHLRKVFQKLGVSSRRDLSGVLLEKERQLA
jgi:DNA-binding CsgD family transcriptional regulator